MTSEQSEFTGAAASGAVAEPAPSRKRLCSMMDFMDRPFSASELQRARSAQAFYAVMSAASYNSQQSPWFKDFVASLRGDYQPLTVPQMHAELQAIYDIIQADVLSRIQGAQHCSVAFDAWSDTHGLPVIAWAVRPAGQEAFIYRLDSVTESQTATFLRSQIERVVAEIESMGVRVTGIVSDGAANCQKAIREVTCKVVPGWCFTHLLSLLMKDVLSPGFCALACLFFGMMHKSLRINF